MPSSLCSSTAVSVSGGNGPAVGGCGDCGWGKGGIGVESNDFLLSPSSHYDPLAAAADSIFNETLNYYTQLVNAADRVRLRL